MSAASLLNFLGVPDYAVSCDVEQAMMEEMYDAGVQVLLDAAAEDVALRLWLNGAKGREWTVGRVPLAELRAGMETVQGLVVGLTEHQRDGVIWVNLQERVADWGRPTLRPVRSVPAGDWDARGEALRLPIPVDLTTLRDDPIQV